MRFSVSLRALAAFLIAPLALTACSSGEPDNDGAGEEELITRVEITLQNDEDLSDRITVTVSDPDGDGSGLTFTPASVTLRPGATYLGTIDLRDTINNTDITDEIEEEAEEHLFRYAFSPSSAGTITATDSESDYGTMDENSGDFAVGLAFQAIVSADASGTGSLDVLLYHFDSAPKASNTATSDEIDVDVSFPVAFAAPAAREAR